MSTWEIFWYVLGAIGIAWVFYYHYYYDPDTGMPRPTTEQRIEHTVWSCTSMMRDRHEEQMADLQERYDEALRLLADAVSERDKLRAELQRVSR